MDLVRSFQPFSISPADYVHARSPSLSHSTSPLVVTANWHPLLPPRPSRRLYRHRITRKHGSYSPGSARMSYSVVTPVTDEPSSPLLLPHLLLPSLLRPSPFHSSMVRHPTPLPPSQARTVTLG